MPTDIHNKMYEKANNTGFPYKQTAQATQDSTATFQQMRIQMHKMHKAQYIYTLHI